MDVIERGGFFFIPALHYTMETAEVVRRACLTLKPDCIACELPEPLQAEVLHAVSRLPDLTAIISTDENDERKVLLVEPVDPCFEGIRYALEHSLPAFCIDLNVSSYPLTNDYIPDPYAIKRIGLSRYYKELSKVSFPKSALDQAREEHMAKKLKELSFSYERILVVVGASHIEAVAELTKKSSFTEHTHVSYKEKTVATITEESMRSVMAEYGWISSHYELWRESIREKAPDRQELLLQLLKAAIPPYEEEIRSTFPTYGLILIMRYLRKWSTIQQRLLPSLYQILVAAKSCIDHNFAYEVWKIATDYQFLNNIDSLQELNLTIEDVWGPSKQIFFHRKSSSRKSSFMQRLKRDKTAIHLTPLSPFTLCSYPPEDSIVETFGKYLQKKSLATMKEEAARTVAFSTSLEDGIDVRETIRHFTEKKLYVKTSGTPQGGAGSIVVIFDDDDNGEKYPWKLSWIGEHEQESDMAFFATSFQEHIVGPGIGKAEYGGFMLSYPPRRLMDVWSDPDYQDCKSKAEILLMSAIDYAVKPVIVYVAERPPNNSMKGYAARHGKKISYLPLSQFSKIALRKVRSFHVLDSYMKREIAGEYID